MVRSKTFSTDQEINDLLQSMTNENIFAALYHAFGSGGKGNIVKGEILALEVFS